MIKMSLDKETILSHEISPIFPANATLSEQPKLTKTHPLRPTQNNQAHPTVPSQRIGKRRYSLGVGFKGLAKRRRRANSDSQPEPILPTHFLLGGNIFDPLNLNSLLDEDINRLTNQQTPKCSPLPLRGGDPVEILVPRDITDPLNLKGGGAEGAESRGVLVSPLKKRRHRNRHHGGGGATEEMPAKLFPLKGPVEAPSPLPCELNTSINCRDDVVPPILPRRHTHPPTGHAHKAANTGDSRLRRRRRTTSMRSSESATASDVTAATPQPTRFQTPLVGGAKTCRSGGLLLSAVTPTKKKLRRRYDHGGHSRYYGYHGCYGDSHEGRVGQEDDPRLRLLRADWFRGRTVLDVGCGAGHMTLAIARRFGPAHILGLDRDARLVHAARQNIRHFLSHDLVLQEKVKEEEELERQGKGDEDGEIDKDMMSFPVSFRASRGPLAPPPLHHSTGFPGNVTFITGDYVSEQEAWPGRGQYDVIMCMGVTKWVQLQSGDGGVTQLFRRAYQSLSPGGIFILEPQPWSSYGRSKRITETVYRNYRALRLRPDRFTAYLTDTIGFTSYRLLTHTVNLRPIYLFHKGSAPRK